MHRLLHYWETFIVATVILYGSLVREPHYQLPPIHEADKWVHLIMYAALGAALLWDLYKDHLRGWKMWSIAIILPTIFGGFIEILQENFFYPRTGDWMDWTADIIGTIIGGLLAYLFAYGWNKRRTQK